MLLLAAALAVVPPTPDWMGELYAQRPDTKLTQIVIPGTHDSGAFKIDTEGTCKLTAIAGANQAEAGTAKTNPCGAGRLAKAQSKNSLVSSTAASGTWTCAWGCRTTRS